MSVAKQHQGSLSNVLHNIFPHQRVVTEARKDASIVHPETGKNLEVDLWFPDIHLGFEYQDEYHYVPTWYSQKSITSIQQSDYIKRNALLQRGETLIVVPCWWDGTEESLLATIQFQRPDLIPETNSGAVALNPPVQFLPENTQLMLASFPVMEPVEFLENRSWWLGEKYDGIRCYWDNSSKKLYTRNGNAIEMLMSVSSLFGSSFLDGEIWCGRGFFHESQYLFRASLDKVTWAQFRVVCFDEASQAVIGAPFEKRYSLILSHYHPEHPTIIIAMRFLLHDSQSLPQILHQVVESGGEGVILRKMQSLYQQGRTPDLIKLKATREDQEALVVGVEDDGALLLELSDLSHITVPKSRCLLPRRATRGDVVTFTYSNLSTLPNSNAPTDVGLPHQSTANVGGHYSPIVFRIRDDIPWKDVAKGTPAFEDSAPLNGENSSAIQTGYRRDDAKRKHLEQLAKLHGFDPLVAENWYNFQSQALEEGRAAVKLCPSGLVSELLQLFPDVSFDVSKFTTHPRNYYLDHTQHQRELFEKYARSQGQDPLNAHFWYSVKSGDYESEKGMKALVSNYGSFKTAVGTIFPEIKFDSGKFWAFPPPTVTIGYWKVVDNRRALFCTIARKQGFDPLLASSWYIITYHSLRHHKFACGILRRFYRGSLKKGLLDMFPDIGLEESKFSEKRSFKERRRKRRPITYPKVNIGLSDVFPGLSSVPVGHWRDVNNRKEVFFAVAQRQGFDPLVAFNWYSVSHASLRHLPVITSPVRMYYGGSLVKALLDLFPNIGLDQQKLQENRI